MILNNNNYNKKLPQFKERHIAKVSDRIHYGEDEQADNKYIVLKLGSWAETDPFLLMAEDWFSTNGFDWHPHRGIETITVVLEGELERRDNRGGHGVLKPGDVQWMTAGRGILHKEMARNKQQVHTLQLWLNLPAESKMVEPTYQDLRGDKASVRREPGVEARVFSGRSGNVEAIPRVSNYLPVTSLSLGAFFAAPTLCLKSSFLSFIPFFTASTFFLNPSRTSFSSSSRALSRASSSAWIISSTS
jgi:quercetin 2,3-dioxygenase